MNQAISTNMEEAAEYITQCRLMGADDSVITQKLLSSGWEQTDVLLAFEAANKNLGNEKTYPRKKRSPLLLWTAVIGAVVTVCVIGGLAFYYLQ